MSIYEGNHKPLALCQKIDEVKIKVPHGFKKGALQVKIEIDVTTDGIITCTGTVQQDKSFTASINTKIDNSTKTVKQKLEYKNKLEKAEIELRAKFKSRYEYQMKLYNDMKGHVFFKAWKDPTSSKSGAIVRFENWCKNNDNLDTCDIDEFAEILDEIETVFGKQIKPTNNDNSEKTRKTECEKDDETEDEDDDIRIINRNNNKNQNKDDNSEEDEPTNSNQQHNKNNKTNDRKRNRAEIYSSDEENSESDDNDVNSNKPLKKRPRRHRPKRQKKQNEE